MHTFTPIGLDFETTGVDFTRHVPIEIGVAIGSESYSTLIGGWDWNTWEWTSEAAAIHGITQEDLDGAPAIGIVDVAIAEFISVHTAGIPVSDRSPVGWNVGSFDMAIVRTWMPRTAEQISHRSVDLNAVCAALDGKHLQPGGWWKNQAKLDSDFDTSQRHRAGYDAQMALREFDSLTRAVRT